MISKIIKTFKYNKFYWKGNIEPANLHKAHRSASWLELFFDLVFVAALGVLVGGLVENFDYYGLFITIIYFLLIWSSWNSLTMYSNIFEQRGVLHQSIIFANLISSALILLPYSNVYVEYIHNKNLMTIFILSIIFSRLIMLLTWLNAYNNVYNKYLKIYLKSRVKIYLISIIFALISIFLLNISLFFVPFIMLLIAIIENFNSFINKGGMISKDNRKFFNLNHLVERFGLFSMLIIGESILAIISNVRGTIISFKEVSTFISFALFIFLVWYLYYEIIMNRAIYTLKYWKMAHIFLHFSFILLAVGINVTLYSETEGMSNILLVSLICYYVSLLFLKKTLNLKETLELSENFDEQQLHKSMYIFNLITVILFIILFVLNLNNILLVINIVNIILIINIILYYYYYIKLMNDIMW